MLQFWQLIANLGLTMHKFEFISKLEAELYDLPNLNDDQYSELDDLVASVSNIFPSSNADIPDDKIIVISSLVKQRIAYSSQYRPSDFTGLVSQIHEVLTNEPTIDFVMSPTSLLAALYYLSDIIAGSSAMGRGTEESIVPDERHNTVICELLAYLHQTQHLALEKIERSSHVRESKKHESILPLIFEIAEITYARLVGWKSEQFKIKQEHVDAFYTTQAECCMAKGSLSILRSLRTLPYEFAKSLDDIKLERPIMEKLLTCSLESRATIASEVTTRRYRGGNSALTWIDIRSTVNIEPFFVHCEESKSVLDEKSELDSACIVVTSVIDSDPEQQSAAKRNKYWKM